MTSARGIECCVSRATSIISASRSLRSGDSESARLYLQPMRDRDVREALRRKVLAEHTRHPDTLVIDELGIAHGSARVDIAVVNGRLHGYEIKSDADTLTRLPAQANAYSAVFDRVTIVAGSKHAQHLEDVIPAWWGIKVATQGPRGGVHFADLRAPRRNPSIAPIELAHLLWRGEAQALLEARAIKGVRGKNRATLYRLLAEHLTLDELRDAVRAALKAREGWRSDVPSATCAGLLPPSAT